MAISKQAQEVQEAVKAPDPSAEVTQENIGKLRPRRKVPGVVGRAAWFA